MGIFSFLIGVLLLLSVPSPWSGKRIIQWKLCENASNINLSSSQKWAGREKGETSQSSVIITKLNSISVTLLTLFIYTLVYQINVQHNLLFFWKIPTCMVLFHPAHFINFGNFSQFFYFYSNKIRKIPTCTALFHPAHLINFEEFSNLHLYSILHDYLID